MTQQMAKQNRLFTSFTLIAGAALLLVATKSMAANVYVAPTKGADLTRAQSQRLTKLVEKAVRNMPEHHLVLSESEADFVLNPTILTREPAADVLRIEKTSAGELLAISEQPIDLSLAAQDRADAQAVTQTAVQDEGDLYAKSDAGRNPSQSETMSGVTTSAGNITGDSLDTRTLQPSASAPGSSASNIGSGQGELRAASPRLALNFIPGYFQVGIGPAIAINLDADTLLYGVNAGYNYNLNPRWTVKGFGDFNFATGNNSAQMIELGAAAEYYPEDIPTIGSAKPYLTGDLGYGNARNGRTRASGDGVALGAGAGFKFASEQLNWDIGLHYAQLTAEVEGKTPSIVGLRAALNF